MFRQLSYHPINSVRCRLSWWKADAFHRARVFTSQQYSSSSGSRVQKNDHLLPVPISYAHGATAYPMLGQTISQRLDLAAEAWPHRESHVVLHQNVRLTFEDLRKRVDQLASGLLALGLNKGDRVGVWAPNCMEWVLGQFATARAGLIQVNVNPAYRPEELAYALRKVGCRALLMSDSFRGQDLYNVLCSVAPEIGHCPPGDLRAARLPDLQHVVLFGSKKPGTWSFEQVMAAGDSKSAALVAEMQKKLQFDDPVNIQFTSGTTGHPKGVTLSHHNILNNAYFCNRTMHFDQELTRLCIPLPLYHCFGMVMGSLATLLHGITCVLPSPVFNAEAALQAVQQEKCTAIYGTPTMFVDMLRVSSKFNVTSLRTGIMSGAPCPQELIRRTVSELHIPELTICYGMTECSPVIFHQRIDEPIEHRLDTVGYATPHAEVKVVNSEGQTVPAGTPGELMVRGYLVMRGYWQEPQKTREVVGEDRWLRTGDLAIMDEHGQGRIVGRLKDMVIRGGENIYPREIEEVLHHHPKVVDAYVFGIPDDRLGEELCVWVKLRPNTTMDADELRRFCGEKLSYFKVPKQVRFVDEFPLTVTGKVQKFKMRDMMIEQLNKQ